MLWRLSLSLRFEFHEPNAPHFILGPWSAISSSTFSIVPKQIFSFFFFSTFCAVALSIPNFFHIHVTFQNEAKQGFHVSLEYYNARFSSPPDNCWLLCSTTPPNMYYCFAIFACFLPTNIQKITSNINK